MWLPALVLFASAVSFGTASPLSSIRKREISQELYDNFVRYMRYANGAYQLACPQPEGNTLVQWIDEESTSTQGYIARDDVRKEILAVFRGSEQIKDFLTDYNQVLTPLESPGIVNSNGAKVHTGFLTTWNSVADNVLSTMQAQIATYPNYTVISTGHSLGGSLAALAGLSFKMNFKSSTVLLYTFGQPRTGDPQWASLVDNTVGINNSFRTVHTEDGVPTTIPTSDGYQHHSTEYWNYADPPSPETTRQCSGDEDPTCSASIPSTGINGPHLYYFGQVLIVEASECYSA